MSEVITESQIDEIVAEMPALSPSVTKILELSKDPMASPKDLMKIIRLDPVLTGKILKLINSAYFSLSESITSLNRALIMLGFNTIKNLALSSAVIDVVGREDCYGFDMDEVWKHCLGVAALSKMIAKYVKVDKTQLESYFIAGLLHDIGKILVMRYFPDEYRRVIEQAMANNTSAFEEENVILGMNHAVIGGLICRKWKIGEELQTSIANHHQICDSFQANVIYLANYYCNRKFIGFRSDVKETVCPDQVWDVVKIEKAVFKEFNGKLPEQIEKASVFLKV